MTKTQRDIANKKVGDWDALNDIQEAAISKRRKLLAAYESIGGSKCQLIIVPYNSTASEQTNGQLNIQGNYIQVTDYRGTVADALKPEIERLQAEINDLRKQMEAIEV